MTSEFQDNFPNDGTKEALGELNALKPDDVAEGVVYVLGTAPHVHVSHRLWSLFNNSSLSNKNKETLNMYHIY